MLVQDPEVIVFIAFAFCPTTTCSLQVLLQYQENTEAIRFPNPRVTMPQLGVVNLEYWHLGVLALVAYAVRLYGQYSRLKDFKGPRTTGFSSLWLINAVKGQKTHLAYASVNERFGKLLHLCYWRGSEYVILALDIDDCISLLHRVALRR